MYNGIGLQTARGSGTNGYIQSNKFFVRPKTSAPSRNPNSGSDEGFGGGAKKPDKGIIDHDRKRRIELRLLVLEETLADQGYTESEIAERIARARENYEVEASNSGPGNGDSRTSDTQTHQVALRKEKQIELFRAALKLSRDQAPDASTQPLKSNERSEELGSKDGDFEEGEYQRGSKLIEKSVAKDVDKLYSTDREDYTSKPSAEEVFPGSKVKNKEASRKGDEKKPAPRKKKDGRNRESRDSDGDISRRKSRKIKKVKRVSSEEDDSSDDDSDSRGTKKKNRKYDTSSSDSDDSSSDSQIRSTKAKALGKKQRKRRRSSSDSDNSLDVKGREASRKKLREKPRADSESESDRGERASKLPEKPKNKGDLEYDGGRRVEKPSVEPRKRPRDEIDSGFKPHATSQGKRRKDDFKSSSEDERRPVRVEKQTLKKRPETRHDSDDSESNRGKRRSKVLPPPSYEKREEHRGRRHDSDSSDSGSPGPKSKMSNASAATDRRAKGGRHDSSDDSSSSDSYGERNTTLSRKAADSKGRGEYGGNGSGKRMMSNSGGRVAAPPVKTRRSPSTEDSSSGSDSSSLSSFSDSDSDSDSEEVRAGARRRAEVRSVVERQPNERAAALGDGNERREHKIERVSSWRRVEDSDRYDPQRRDERDRSGQSKEPAPSRVDGGNDDRRDRERPSKRDPRDRYRGHRDDDDRLKLRHPESSYEERRERLRRDDRRR